MKPFHFILFEIGSYISVVPLLVAYFTRNKMLPEYRPLVWYLAVSLTNEIISSIAWYSHHSALSKPFTNTYLVIFPILLIWQFRTWKLFYGKEKLYRCLLFMQVFLWILLLFVFGSLFETTNWFRLTSYIVLTLISISNLNRIISRNTPDLLHNTNFIVTAACIFYFPVRLIVEVFYMYGLDKDLNFILQVVVIANFDLIVFYLLIAYGLLQANRKQPISLIY